MKPSRILIVEDEGIVAVDIESRLIAMGYEAAGHADNGDEALALTGERRPDLVLMDIRLQGDMDGIMAADKIRQRFHVPVIFLTSYSERTTVERAKLAEPFGYLLKPFNDDELQSTIEIAIYRHRAEEEIRRMNRLYDVLSQVNQTIVRIRSREELLPTICRLMVERGAVDLAWIGWLDPQTGRISPAAHFGHGGEMLHDTDFHVGDRPEGQGNPAKAVREGEPFVCNECGVGGCPYPSAKAPARFGFQSCGSFPLSFQGQVCGTLSICVAEPGFFRGKEMSLLKEVALDISFALDKIESDNQRERLTEELKQRSGFLQTLLDAMPYPVFYKDAQLRYLGCNTAFEKFVGFTRNRLMGKTVYDIWPRDLADLCDRFDKEMLANKDPEPQMYEGTMPAGDGVRHDMVFHKAAFYDEGGAVGGIIGAMVDITERKRGEAERRKLRDQLLQAQKMESIGQLAGGVAHDFNNLLTVIEGYCDIMQDLIPTGDPLQPMLDQVQSAGKRAAALTRQLLAFSRKQILAPVTLDLDRLVTGLREMLGRLIGEDITLSTTLRPGLWPITADPGQIEQVIMNLAVNARDAMPTGGMLTIETDNVHLDGSYAETHIEPLTGPFVMVAVTDTGHGMDEPTRARIFEPFFTTKELGKGTGLGLATVYGIVKQSGGSIAVYSEPGRGTTFKIFLPADRTAASAQHTPQPILATASGEETILLVEDDKMVRYLVRTLLEGRGYTVLEAPDGDDALSASAQCQGPIHLMLTDVVMPKMGGRELAERMKVLRPAMKVLFMSGYTDDAVFRHGLLTAEVEFLPKPFTLASLTSKVREVLDKERA